MKKTILALALGLVATASFAGSMGKDLYVLGSVGQTEFRDLTAQSLGGGVTGVDNKDYGVKIGAGWQFHKNFSLEGSYSDLGRFDVTSGAVVDVTKASSTDLALVANYSLAPKWDLNGKVGVARTAIRDASGRDTHTTGLYGIGVDYALTKKVSVGVSWDRYHDFGDSGRKLDNFSVGAKYRF